VDGHEVGDMTLGTGGQCTKQEKCCEKDVFHADIF
jgi:hypothetical protein